MLQGTKQKGSTNREREYLISERKQRVALTKQYVDKSSFWEEELAGMQSGNGKGYDDATRTAIKERWT
jgi:hypothetical protein